MPDFPAAGPEREEPQQWAFRKIFQTGGHVFEFACQHEEIARPFFLLMDHLQAEEPASIDTRFWVLEGLERGTWDICLDGRILEKDIPGATVLPTLLMANFACSCNAMRDKLLFHAAVIKMGSAVTLFPGRTTSGKSTLAAALAARGHLFFSDELAILDVDKRTVSPFALPVSVKPGSVQALTPFYHDLPDQQAYLRADSKKVRYIIPLEGVPSGGERALVGRLVFPKFVEGAPARMRELGKAEALHSLAMTCSSNRELTGRDIEAMIAVVEKATCYELHFSSLEEAVDSLEKNI